MEFRRHRIGLRRRCGKRRQFQMMTGEVEQSAIVKSPAFARRRHQIPAMHVADVQVAGDSKFGQRTFQLGIGEHVSMDAKVAAVKQACQLRNGCPIQVNMHGVELALAVRAGL